MRIREVLALLVATAIFLTAVPLGYYTIKGSGTWMAYFEVMQQGLNDSGYVALVGLMLITMVLIARYHSFRSWVCCTMATPPFVDALYDLSALLAILRHPKTNLKILAQRFRTQQNTSLFTPSEANKHRVTFEKFIETLSRQLPTKVLSITNNTNEWFVEIRGKCLYNLVHNLRPSVVVETGVAAGKASIYLLHALQENSKGMLISIDLPDYQPTYFGESVNSLVGFLVPPNLKDRWRLELEDSLTALPRIAEEFEIDLFIHDSLHTYDHIMFECETVWPHLRPGGVLLVHDVNKAFVDFAHKVGRPYVVWERYGGLVK